LSDSKTYFNLKDHLWFPFLVEEGYTAIDRDDKVYAGCNCGICHMTLLDSGAVYACRRFNSPIGHINNDSWEELFFGTNMEKYREVKSIDGCNKCRFLNYCRGCRAVAYGTYGSSFAKDPQCWLSGRLEAVS
jgi:radical SAM protein with 4Fe4S-binding SPASM domain